MTFRGAFYACFLLFLSTISTAFADEIQLKNGDRITGTIVNKTENSILINTAFAGDIMIKWDAVSTLTSDQPITVKLDDDSLLKGQFITANDGTVVLSADKVFKTDPLPLSRISAINPPIADGKTVFKGIANIGAYKTAGNTKNQSVHLDAELVARRTNDRFSFGAAFNQDKTDSIQSAKNSIAYAKYDYFFNEKLYAFGNTSFEKDRFKDLKLRSVLGGGLGYQFWENDISNLSVEAGPSYVNEDYYSVSDKDFASGRWAVNYDRWFYQKVAQFFHFHEGLFPFSDTGDIYIRSRTGVRIPLIDKFTITAEVDLDYDAKPVAGNKKTDTRYLFNLGYSW